MPATTEAPVRAVTVRDLSSGEVHRLDGRTLALSIVGLVPAGREAPARLAVQRMAIDAPRVLVLVPQGRGRPDRGERREAEPVSEVPLSTVCYVESGESAGTELAGARWWWLSRVGASHG